MHQFSPLKAIANNPEQDIELKARDKVVVFSRFQSKEDEEIALDSLALTQEQIKLREKMALWDDFEQKQFYEFIDLGDSLDKELAEQVEKQLAEEDKNRVTAITEILNKKLN